MHTWRDRRCKGSQDSEGLKYKKIYWSECSKHSKQFQSTLYEQKSAKAVRQILRSCAQRKDNRKRNTICSEVHIAGTEIGTKRNFGERNARPAS